MTIWISSSEKIVDECCIVCNLKNILENAFIVQYNQICSVVKIKNNMICCFEVFLNEILQMLNKKWNCKKYVRFDDDCRKIYEFNTLLISVNELFINLFFIDQHCTVNKQKSFYFFWFCEFEFRCNFRYVKILTQSNFSFKFVFDYSNLQKSFQWF